MPEVEVRFRTVLSHEAFAVLARIQKTRIHIEIRVALLNGNRNPLGLQNGTDASRRNSFSNPRQDTACHKYKLCLFTHVYFPSMEP